jgi:metal-dependent amidase/aminoacylase/carboxypeptidase family protein
VVDIKGTAPAVSIGKKMVKSVALRADMDALPMKENDENLEYKT